MYFGLRIPFYLARSAFALDVEPRLGVSFTINDKHTVYFDRSTQPLFSLNRTYGGQPIDFWMPFVDDVLQTSNQVAIGWKYKPIPSLFFLIEGYYKQLKNIHYAYNEGEIINGAGGYNIGDGYAFGGELVAQYTGRTTVVTLAYSHSESKRIIDGIKHNLQYYIPYVLTIFTKQQTLKRENRVHNVSANIIFKAGLPYVLTNEVFPYVDFGGNSNSNQAPSNPTYPNTRLNNYFRIDLNYSIEKKLKHGSRIWQFSILNVTNHFNPHYVYPKGEGFRGVLLIPIMP